MGVRERLTQCLKQCVLNVLFHTQLSVLQTWTKTTIPRFVDLNWCKCIGKSVYLREIEKERQITDVLTDVGPQCCKSTHWAAWRKFSPCVNMCYLVAHLIKLFPNQSSHNLSWYSSGIPVSLFVQATWTRIISYYALKNTPITAVVFSYYFVLAGWVNRPIWGSFRRGTTMSSSRSL